MTAARVTIVTVSYNSAAVLGQMLGSCPSDIPVIVVDNGSADIDALRKLTHGHGARLIENAENLGFGSACNLGAAAAETEFVFFLNPDARLNDGTIAALLATADANPQAVAFNPVVVGGNGQPAPKRKSDLIARSEFMPRGMPDHDSPIYTLNGAAVMVRTDSFRHIGGFDPGIFLFFEDDDLAARLRDAGGGLMLSRAARIDHIGGAGSSGPRLPAEIFKAWHTGYSRAYVMRKHRRPLARSRALTHAGLRMLSPVVLVSRGHRARRLAFLRGTLAALTGAQRPLSPTAETS